MTPCDPTDTPLDRQKTIAEQNARIATLEKQQAAQPQKSAAKTAANGRSVNVAGIDVPIADLPANALPKEKSAVRDADTFGDVQQAAPRVNNAPLDPKLKGFIAYRKNLIDDRDSWLMSSGN